jgi:succinate dehydrogenase hydrophobic anchor subunit
MTRQTWLVVGVSAVALIAAIAIYLFVNRPWESREYKDCVRQAQNILGKDFDTSQIEETCHQMYG